MNNMHTVADQIEALLFALGRPLSRRELAHLLKISSEDTELAIAELLRRGKEGGRGIVAVDDGTEIELRAQPGVAALVESIRREEISRDLGHAGAEVVAILLYRGPLSRGQIDFIRGVNSTAALRTLAVRGLVRKVEGQNGGIHYELTTDIIAALGIRRPAEAPQWAEIQERLEALQNAHISRPDAV